MKTVVKWMESAGPWSPWLFLGLFVAASVLMIWRLEAMTESGIEGTVLGTLIMPYCSGMGNLIFTFLLATQGGPGREVMTNALVNNVTNMTLLIGLPAILWGMNVVPSRKTRSRKSSQQHQINRLSLLLTLTAALFFTGAMWALAQDGRLDAGDGLVLVGLFLFWQCFHVIDVLKSNVRQNESFSWLLPMDLALLGVGTYGIYLSVNWLVAWVSNIHTGFISAQHQRAGPDGDEQPLRRVRARDRAILPGGDQPDVAILLVRLRERRGGPHRRATNVLVRRPSPAQRYSGRPRERAANVLRRPGPRRPDGFAIERDEPLRV